MSMSAENTMQAGNSGLSVAALVLGILSVVTSFSWVLGVPMGILPAASDLSTDHLTHIKAVVSEGEPTKEQAVYQAGADCDGDESSRVYSVKVELEDGTIYCQD